MTADAGTRLRTIEMDDIVSRNDDSKAALEGLDDR